MLFDAWQWDTDREPPKYDAERDGVPIGAAWYRLFTQGTAQRGYIAEVVPELAIAVVDSARGSGTGRRLMERLVEQARTESRRGISLHVNGNNQKALRMYESLGFAESCRDAIGPVMLLSLGDHPSDP